jgi:hypothetical protein
MPLANCGLFRVERSFLEKASIAFSDYQFLATKASTTGYSQQKTGSVSWAIGLAASSSAEKQPGESLTS